MKTKQQILDAVSGGKGSECLDGRDFERLAEFFDAKDLGKFNLELKEGAVWEAKDFTEANILEQLKEDLAFGFKKALDCRGISSSLMYNVVKMWLWVLDDDLQYFSDYAQYGAFIQSGRR